MGEEGDYISIATLCVCVCVCVCTCKHKCMCMYVHACLCVRVCMAFLLWIIIFETLQILTLHAVFMLVQAQWSA